MKKFWIGCFYLLASWGRGESLEQVLFLEVRNPKGELIVLEPDFPYSHVMVSVREEWVHSHPKTGVQVIEDSQVNAFGEPKEVFQVQIPDQNKDKVDSWIHRPYDSAFAWTDERFYCSELVAKILGIEPEPMHFDPTLWPPSFQALEGLPGISPGKIYRYLKARGFSF